MKTVSIFIIILLGLAVTASLAIAQNSFLTGEEDSVVRGVSFSSDKFSSSRINAHQCNADETCEANNIETNDLTINPGGDLIFLSGAPPEDEPNKNLCLNVHTGKVFQTTGSCVWNAQNLFNAEPGDVVQLPIGETLRVRYGSNKDVGVVFVTMTAYNSSQGTLGGDATFQIEHHRTDGTINEYTLIAGPDNSIGLVIEIFKTSDLRSVISVPVSLYLI